MDDYDDILGIIDNDISGINFNFRSIFKIVDMDNGLHLVFHKLYKKNYKLYKTEINTIINKPIIINDILNIDISDFKINKLYDGLFYINFYDNNTYDIFLIYNKKI
jgi:hypothetical protein